LSQAKYDKALRTKERKQRRECTKMEKEALTVPFLKHKKTFKGERRRRGSFEIF